MSEKTIGKKKNKHRSIARKMWANTPRAIRLSAGSAVIVSMAASIVAASEVDEIGKAAVQDMAHELSYTWNPFDGMLA